MRLGPDDVEYPRVNGCGCVIAGMMLEALTVEKAHGDCLLVLDRMREEFVDGWMIEGIQSTVRRQEFGGARSYTLYIPPSNQSLDSLEPHVFVYYVPLASVIGSQMARHGNHNG